MALLRSLGLLLGLLLDLLLELLVAALNSGCSSGLGLGVVDLLLGIPSGGKVYVSLDRRRNWGKKEREWKGGGVWGVRCGDSRHGKQQHTPFESS